MDHDVEETMRVMRYRVYQCFSEGCPNEGSIKVHDGVYPSFWCTDHLLESKGDMAKAKNLWERLAESPEKLAFMELSAEETESMPGVVARARSYSPQWKKVYVPTEAGATFADLFSEELVESEVEHLGLLRFRGSQGLEVE